jgi:transforming growth factor-beta-induced protein
MQLSYLIQFALASAVKGASLMGALASQNTTLSTLNCTCSTYSGDSGTNHLPALLATEPALVQMLTTAKDITILAPSNDAFASFVQNPENKAAAADSATLMAVLEYHVLKGMHMASAFTSTMQFLPTMLGASSNMTMGSSMMSNMSLSSVTGGQVVSAIKMDNIVEIMSGLKETSMVKTADIMFEGGVIHIIDSVLTVPKMPSVSALDSQLTALAGALKKTNLVMAVDMMKDVTIFAPSNAAFQAIGSATGALTEQELASILEYHIVNGTVGYSTLLSMGLTNQTIPTLEGPGLKVQVTNNKVFVNGAQVEIADVLISNGVMHVVNA